MADVRPLRALHYDPAVAGPLQDLVAPPYDVIGPEERARLAAASPYNVVHIDLPEPAAPAAGTPGGDPYAHAAELFAGWQQAGVLRRDDEPAFWALTQDYTAPGGAHHTRRGFFARVRVEDYGAGRIRPHERTHPGPKEDRLRLTCATRANLSPIFSLYSDPEHRAWRALDHKTTTAEPFGEVTDADGTTHRLWRIADPAAIDAAQHALADAELLIADGHHRYETARVYADEVGGEGPHRYVLMCLVALEDPGLLVFPTHRLVHGLTAAQRRALARTLEEQFSPGGDGPGFAYLDANTPEPVRLALRDASLADEALAAHAPPYRRLDTAVLEELVLKRALGMTEDDIAELRGLAYSKDAAAARAAVGRGEYDAAFLMRPTPVEQVREVAAAAESMPPKSTYFFPKIPTGLLLNLLADRRTTMAA